MPATGHSAVLGTAGSGKTTLVLYRAAYLSDSSTPHAGKTLLLTFNKALVTYLEYLKPAELTNVQIETYHTFARGYLNHRGKMSSNAICARQNVRKSYIAQAVNAIKSSYEPSKFFERPISFFMDEIQWIFSHGITSSDKYKQVKRVGRSDTNLSRELRPVMYEILEEYIKLRKQGKYIYDWDDMALHVREEFKSDTSPRCYKHIIIDEGQDFSPEMLRSLAAAIPDDKGSLSFFGDVAQQIYGQRMSWRNADLKISKKWPEPWIFKENYRNTKQIARLGLAISEMEFFKDIPDLVEPTSQPAAGPLPDLIKCSNKSQQIEITLKTARDAAETQKAAILLRTREQEEFFRKALEEDTIRSIRLHRDLKNWDNAPAIYYGTYHAAKGLEFDRVILPFLGAEDLPDEEYIKSHGEESALTYCGRLLYVAVTRAKLSLILLYCDEPTPLLPVNKALYSPYEF